MAGDQQGFYCEADHSSQFIVEPYLHYDILYKHKETPTFYVT
jgi:hypothetical protein